MFPGVLGCSLIALGAIAPQSSGSADPAAAAVERWRAHYAAVERELAAREPEGLDAARRAARAELIASLAAYRERGEFTRQERADVLVPQFVDAEGRLCAVAELLHASGNDALVRRVHAEANDAWIAELAGDRAFLDWLDAHGLTLLEAARIQTPANTRGPGDSAGPADDLSPPKDEPADRPGSTPAPTLGPGAPPTVFGAPSIVSAASDSAASEAWWMWWEFNKLTYLGVRGMETRLGLSASPADIAQMTDPLRATRLPLLTRLLGDTNAQVRASAALALGRVAREHAVEPLIAALADPASQVREHALLGLGASGTSEGARVLLAVLEHGGRVRDDGEPVSPRAVPLAILALAIGRRAGMEPGVAQSVALFAPRSPASGRDAALWAACLFHRLAPDPATEALALELLADDDASRIVRAGAIEALGASTDPAVLARLQDQLFGRDLELRRSAALTLGQSPQALATSALLTAGELESEPLTRGFVLLALGMRGGVAARDLLLDALRKGPIAGEPWAALALGIHARTSGDPAIASALLEAVPHARNEDSRPALLVALGLAREPRAAALARRTLADGRSPRERGYAATALALLGDDASRDFLRLQLAVERSGFVRATIAQALSTLGDATDVPSLDVALTRLADPVQQAVTAASLGLLGEPSALAVLERRSDASEAPALLRATALDALGVLLERGVPMVLPEVSRGANYALYEDLAYELFHLTL